MLVQSCAKKDDVVAFVEEKIKGQLRNNKTAVSRQSVFAFCLQTAVLLTSIVPETKVFVYERKLFTNVLTSSETFEKAFAYTSDYSSSTSQYF